MIELTTTKRNGEEETLKKIFCLAIVVFSLFSFFLAETPREIENNQLPMRTFLLQWGVVMGPHPRGDEIFQKITCVSGPPPDEWRKERRKNPNKIAIWISGSNPDTMTSFFFQKKKEEREKTILATTK